jgi:DNA-binding response OmpR family regulator
MSDEIAAPLLGAGDTAGHRILVIDDSPGILQVVSRALERAGYVAVPADSAEMALGLIKQYGLPHLAVVDISMPGMSGLEFCETIQEFSDLPVIILTAVGRGATVVKAIEYYAEDFMTKPFSPKELVARVRRVLHRIGGFAFELTPLIQVDDHLQVAFANCEAVVDGQTVSLTPTENKLLYLLMRSAGQAVTADFLLRRLWPREAAYEDRLRVYVHRLRKKIEPQDHYQYIISERGTGYRFQKKARPFAHE